MTSKLFLVAISLSLLLVAGCNKKSGSTVQNSNKVRVGYIGLTCEAPIYAAYEKGFFKEEGLEPELVKCNWSTTRKQWREVAKKKKKERKESERRVREGGLLKEGGEGSVKMGEMCNWSTYKDTLALGGYDITHHLVMYFLKPIEQGLDVRFLAGIHRGCLRVQAGVKTNIHTIQDLKGKRIGVPGMGTPPFVFANRVFGVHGIDASKDITWKVFPAGELGLAIDKGEVDAVANAEPIGSLLIAEGKVRNIADQIMDAPYKDEYCCEVIANGKWVDANPDTAAKATRALLKGAKWVETNPRAAAVMAVEKKYLASTPELNTVALARLRYIPSVQLAEESVQSAGREMKVAKMLSPETDTEALAKRAFMHLPGVTDEWIKTIEVEKIAGAQVSPDEDIRLIAALIQKDSGDSCCRRKMFDQPDQDAPNLADPDAPCVGKNVMAAGE